MRTRSRRMLVALLGILAVAALAPQLASADTANGAISGTVTNAAAQTVAGVTVGITSVTTGQSYSAVTASDGTYVVGGVPSGSYQVLFRPGAGQNYVYQYYPNKSNAAAAQAVSVTSGQTTSHVDATLATGATISGTVTAATGGAPLSGVYVYVRDYGGGYPTNVYTTSTRTDSTGAWSLAALPTGTYQVQFSPSYPTTYASQYYNDVNGQDPPTPIALTAGSTTSNIDAALITGGQITGTVTAGMTGAPAAGVFVSAVDASGNQWASSTTDSGGHYTLSGLSASASYRVDFSPPQGSLLATEFYPSGATLKTATPVPVTVGQTTPNIDETLSEGGSISGVVTDAATGYPIGGVQVLLTNDAGQPVSSEFITTEQDGSYDATNLPPGAYKVEFSSEGALGFQYYNHASTLSAATSITINAGQSVTNINGALTQGGALEGTITNASTGQGFPNDYVELLDARGNLLVYGFTGPDGHYEISGIAPGSYYVEFVAYDNGLTQASFYGGSRTLAGATPVTITAGATTRGIDLALAPESATTSSVSGQSTGTPTTTTTTTTRTPPVAQATGVTPGSPTLSRGSVSGLAKGKPVVMFHLAAGANGGHKLRSFKVKLPAGLSFVAAQLAKGVKVTGAGKVTEKVTAGQLVVILGSPAKAVTVSISSPAVKVTARVGHPVRIGVTVTPVNGTGHLLSFTVKNPS